jgi:hypothetical protein
MAWPIIGMQAMTGEEAAARLAEMGFENVRVSVSEGEGMVYAAFEPTSYRGTYRGAAVALQELGKLFADKQTFRVVVLENQQPQVALSATKADEVWSVKGDYNFEDINNVVKESKKTNSSAGKFDFTVHPMFTWVNHRLDQMFEYVLAVAPTIETSLWKGNRITLQAVIPVSYDAKTIQSASYVHVGVADIAQEVVSANGRWQATLAGGFFFFDRIGFDLRVGYRVTPNLTLGGEASLTGEAVVRDGHYDIGKPDHFSFFGKAEYYEPVTRLQGQLMAGRFVFGDYGARLDISRHFGDYTIGLYGILTGGEHNAGFHFAIPLGPKRQKRSGAVRLKLPEYFDWEYSMVSYYEYYDQQMGKHVETRPDENRSAHYWQPVHVAQYAEKILNGEIK